MTISGDAWVPVLLSWPVRLVAGVWLMGAVAVAEVAGGGMRSAGMRLAAWRMTRSWLMLRVGAKPSWITDRASVAAVMDSSAVLSKKMSRIAGR